MDSMSHQIARVIACLAILLVFSLTPFCKSLDFLLHRSVSAQDRARADAQKRQTIAPSTHIRPASVSVIDFTKLAERDAKASRERQANAGPVLRAVDPVKTIKEVDSVPVNPAAEPAKINPSRPLVSSPAPSQTFPAQEDAPQFGTNTFVIPPDTMGAVGLDKLFVTVNNNYRVQDKATGAVLSTVSIETFWSSTGAAGVFDPRVQYDPYNNRWIL